MKDDRRDRPNTDQECFSANLSAEWVPSITCRGTNSQLEPALFCGDCFQHVPPFRPFSKASSVLMLIVSNSVTNTHSITLYRTIMQCCERDCFLSDKYYNIISCNQTERLRNKQNACPMSNLNAYADDPVLQLELYACSDTLSLIPKSFFPIAQPNIHFSTSIKLKFAAQSFPDGIIPNRAY